MSDASQQPPADNSDIADLGFEEARDELARIVATLEAGSTSLEESMKLWERGEALAKHCHSWLDDATERVRSIVGAAQDQDAEAE